MNERTGLAAARVRFLRYFRWWRERVVDRVIVHGTASAADIRRAHALAREYNWDELIPRLLRKS